MPSLTWTGTVLCIAMLSASAAVPHRRKKKDLAVAPATGNRRPNLAAGRNPAFLRDTGAAAGRLQVGRRVGSHGQPAPAASAGKGRLSRAGRRLAQRAATHRVAGDHPRRARLSHQEAALRGPAGPVHPGPVVRAGKARRPGARGDERQWPRGQTGQGRALQADSLHQSSQTRDARLEPRVARHGPTRRPRLPARLHEPTRPVRHQRPGALLSDDGAGPGRALEPRPRRPQPRRSRRTLRRRLANHLHQFARSPRYAGQSRGRLFELSHPGVSSSRTWAIPSRRPATWPRWSTTRT